MNDPKSRVEWRTILYYGDVGGFEYRALYTNHKLSNIDRFNSYLTDNANTKFGTKQVGYYYELAKDLGHMIGTSWYVARSLDTRISTTTRRLIQVQILIEAIKDSNIGIMG